MIKYRHPNHKYLSDFLGCGYDIPICLDKLYSLDYSDIFYGIKAALDISNDNLILFYSLRNFYFKSEKDILLFKIKYGL